jgi:hypothetical protein
LIRLRRHFFISFISYAISYAIAAMPFDDAIDYAAASMICHYAAYASFSILIISPIDMSRHAICHVFAILFYAMPLRLRR